MQKFLFDKEIVNNQLSVLNNTLASQRQTKKTLLSHLEKFSDAMYENFNSENTDLLLSLINEAHSVFECIKSNIAKTLELKKFLESIYNSNSLNTIDSEKFNNDFNSLLENISKTNSNYLSFMNNYKNFIKPNFVNEDTSAITVSEEIITKKPILENNPKNEIIEPLTEETIPEPTVETSSDENITEIPEEQFVKEPISETTTDSPLKEEIIDENIEKKLEEVDELEEESLFEKMDEPQEDNSLEDLSPSLDLQEKVLIINKKLGIAILPYSISDLDELFLDDPEKYSSIQDIIDKEYTVNLKDFENSSISRYKEAFKLAKDKSNYTFPQAANFAKKLLSTNEIKTLIIASCRNVEELDFYIECLNNNKLNEFNHFKIIEI